MKNHQIKKQIRQWNWITLMVGNVLFSFVLWVPGMLPADLPSHSYRNLRPLEAGCSTMSTYMSLGPLWNGLLLFEWGLFLCRGTNFSSTISKSFMVWRFGARSKLSSFLYISYITKKWLQNWSLFNQLYCSLKLTQLRRHADPKGRSFWY